MTRTHAAAAGLLAAGAWTCLLAGALQAAEPAGAKGAGKKLRVVVLTGGHGYDKKKFPQAFAGHEDIGFEIRQAGKKGAPGVFDDACPYDVIVLYNFAQRLSATQRANFLKLTDKGVGLVVLHHAIVAYPAWSEWAKIIGARYYLKPTVIDGVQHARSIWKHGVDMNIHVHDPNHPVTKGLKDFTVNDETYGKWSYLEGNRLLLTTDHPLNNRQIAWARPYRKSRVVFFQLGHGPTVFSDANYRRVIARSIRYTAGRIGPTRPAAAPARKTTK